MLIWTVFEWDRVIFHFIIPLISERPVAVTWNAGVISAQVERFSVSHMQIFVVLCENRCACIKFCQMKVWHYIGAHRWQFLPKMLPLLLHYFFTFFTHFLHYFWNNNKKSQLSHYLSDFLSSVSAFYKSRIRATLGPLVHVWFRSTDTIPWV